MIFKLIFYSELYFSFFSLSYLAFSKNFIQVETKYSHKSFHLNFHLRETKSSDLKLVFLTEKNTYFFAIKLLFENYKGKKTHWFNFRKGHEQFVLIVS